MRLFDGQKWLAIIVMLAISLGGAYYLSSREQPETTLYVPQGDFPAYSLLTTTDLTTTTLPSSEVPAEALLQEMDLANRYSRLPLPAGKTVIETQMVPAVDEQYVLDTAVVSIPATAAMVYNGQLVSGEMVTVWAVTETGQVEPLLNEALVLDVQQVEEQNEAEGNAYPYVVVLAVPESQQEALLTAVANGFLMLIPIR